MKGLAMEQSSVSRSQGWTVVAAGTGINLILGSLYAWSVIGKVLVKDWKWSNADAALPFSISTACFAFTMIFAGRWQDKMGPRIVALFGGLMFGLGLFTSAYAHTPLAMVLSYGLLGGIGIGLCYSATTPPALKWFPPGRKGLIAGIVVSGVGLAAVYVSPLTQWLLAATSVSQTFEYLGIGAVVLICLLSLKLINPPAGYVVAPAPAGGPGKPKSAVKADLDWHEMLRTRQFYMLWLMLLLGASAGLMIIAHAAKIGRDQAGIDKWGFLPVALLAIFNTLGRLISGSVSDRMGRTQTLMLAFFLQALNMFAFSYYQNPAMLIFGACFTGLCYGTIFPLMPAAIADFYGVKNLGVNYGLLFTAFGVAGIAGPILGGKIRDLSGAFTYSYIISAVMLLIGAALAFATRPPKATAEVEPQPDAV
jgi:OFA family oxalate/formate antiporter-like MFS transporter